ncbi:single-stranded DNA-binding protein [Apilactobacillus micheneri]|uniref:ERF family protein n=1 Tax=Apilactobacillus micheneri TaxID=1899430 RepID=UPI001126B68B|nr:ERF family protein [Apilactobacillus micheneri]TPR46991.1 single-stranded DNA-binding protein [Apilactobacillus micheneri]
MKIEVNDPKDKVEILKAFAKFQSQVESPKKDQDNPFTKSKYAGLESVINAVTKGMKGTGLSFVQDFVQNDNPKILSVQTILLHDKGIITFSPINIPIEKANAQGIGSANTYARRYALATNLAITGEADDDGNSASQSNNYGNNYSNRKPYKPGNNQQSNNSSSHESEQQKKFKKFVVDYKKVTGSDNWQDVVSQAMASLGIKDGLKDLNDTKLKVLNDKLINDLNVLESKYLEATK